MVKTRRSATATEAKASPTKGVDKKLVAKAVEIIQKAIIDSRDPRNLLQDQHELINLNFELNQLPAIHTVRPQFIKLPNPIYTREHVSQVCILTKDPQNEWRQKIDGCSLKQLPITKVMSIGKLGTNYKQFSQRRKLLSEVDLFLSDVRVWRMLPSRTGKGFYDAKKTPVLVDMENDKKLASNIEAAIQGTYLVMGAGPAYNVKACRVSMSAANCVKNIEAVANELISMFGADRIRRMEVKGNGTVSLPIYWHLTKAEREAMSS